MQELDSELLLKSLIFMADGVATIIGENGARATMRLAGHRAAVNLLDALPLLLEVDAAIQRAGPIMQELGYIEEMTQEDDSRMLVRGNVIATALRELGLGLPRHPACYYTIGLFEGFVYVLSRTHVSVIRHEMQGENELWTLQR